MIKSMTGYAKSANQNPKMSFQMEIKTLNSKNLDLLLRIPASLKANELEIKNLIAQKVVRGKVDVMIKLDLEGSDFAVNIDKKAAKIYINELKSLAEENKLPLNNVLSIVANLPGIISTDEMVLNEENWRDVQNYIYECLECLDKFRISEGTALENALKNYVKNIEYQLNEISQFEKQRIEDTRIRLLNNFMQFRENVQLDKERFEQEIFYYIEKLDITEEKVRLKQHCDYFIQTLSECESGKKLAFIAQEMGREINTIGSKANNVHIQKLVVQMKDELEKIKEQVNNVL